jgi:hypothetical protein
MKKENVIHATNALQPNDAVKEKAKEIVSLLSGWDYRSAKMALDFAGDFLGDNAVIPSEDEPLSR